MDNQKKSYVLNPPDFNKAIENSRDFFVQFHSMTPEIEFLVIRMVQRFLEQYDLSYMKEPILSITRELIANGIKANLKRLYFKIKKLDINKTEDYRRGMESFKSETYIDETDDFFGQLEKSNMVIRLSFKSTEENIFINVINNSPVLDSELAKINARIKKAYQYTNIAEAFDEVLDDSEGAGLGLIIAMMVFKNTGLPSDSFRIYKKNDLTIATITISQSHSIKKVKMEIASEILQEFEEIPAFPKNIDDIQRLCANPDIHMKEIAGHIARDPGLTTSILKLANSAGYYISKKIESLEEAAKIIGVKGISTLLLATGVHRIMDSRYKRFESIWDDSYRRAAYAQKIAVQTKQSKAAEFAYLVALLSNIGYITMLSIKPELLRKFQELAGWKGFADTMLLEEISLGISHASLGGMICKKWNFNENLVKAIEYHHRPHIAPSNIKQLVYMVYLADCMIEIEKNKCRFEIIDSNILKFFNIDEKSKFELLHKALRDSQSDDESHITFK